MKIGILQTGPVNPALTPTYGEYVDVFRAWLAPHDPSLTFENWAVIEDVLPQRPDQADLWLITGSRHGVYEDHSWLEPLKAFIRACRDARAPMIGVCFGHQVMAEALGGQAVKSEKGWGLGPHDYEPLSLPDWMPKAPETLTLHAIHQDQVTERPPETTLIARSPFCENAALLYGDPDAPWAISIQPHPEFSDQWTSDLLHVRADSFPKDRAEPARARLGDPLHRDWAAEWFLRFARLSSA